MKSLLFLLCIPMPVAVFGGWNQAVTSGSYGDDIPATADSPKLYHVGSDVLPFDSTELPVMYPQDRLWFDVTDAHIVISEYIREVVNNRYLNLHHWETSQNYFSAQPMAGKLDKDYLKALHARMAFFSKLLQMPYPVAREESHAKASASIMWADYNDMVDQGSLRLSNGVGISYPGWVVEQDRQEFWRSHHPDMTTNLISGPGANYSFQGTAGYVNHADLPIDPTDFLISSPHHTRNIAQDLASQRPTVWALSDTRDPANVHANYGTLPQDKVSSPFKTLAYYTNKSYPFIGFIPSTLTPDTWYFTTGWGSTKRPLILDETTGEWKRFWEPVVLSILPASLWALLDSNGNRISLSGRFIDNMVEFTPVNAQGDPANLGRGLANGEIRSYSVHGKLLLEVLWTKDGEDSYTNEVPYDVLYNVHIVGTEQLDYVVWPDESQVAYDIKYNAAWGFYNTGSYPWIWRYTTGDWIYLVDTLRREANQKHYFYSPTEQSWLFISSASPLAFHFAKGVWIAY